MPTEGTHRVGVVAELPALLLELGIDPHAVLDAAGVPRDMLRNTENRIPFAMLGRLMAEAAARTGCDHIAALMALRGGLHSLGLIGRLMGTAPTVREALMDLCVNQVRYIEGAVTYLTIHDGVGAWGYSVQSQPLRGVPAIMDGAMGAAVAFLRDLGGHTADEMRFSHAPPADVMGFRKAFGSRCVFDAEQTAVILSPRTLAAPVRTADPVLRQILQRQVVDYWARAQPTMAEQVRRMVAAHVTTGDPTQEVIASALGIGPRTLNRRLQQEGTSFRAVLDQACHDVACQLLGTTRLSVTDIGLALGYANSPGFVRAFKRSANIPPSEWRRLNAMA